ncbi:MAG: DUF2851 family protein, partial [Chthoniobacteraceae bacterium]
SLARVAARREHREMNAGDRYAALLSPPAREESLLRAPRRIDEHELQARWFAGEFGREFTTTDGRAVAITQFGVWNREAGPDFIDAAVALDGAEPARGCIELDMDVRDWERHGHAGNPAFESAVLHVFTQRGEAEFFTRTHAHRLVPQVLLDLSRLTDEPPNPQPDAKPGRCVAPLRELPEEKVREVLLGAAEHRLRRKAAALARLGEIHGADEALHQALAATLGYKSNKLPFTLLAQRLPLKLLRAAKDDADALIFGVAGFLPKREFPPESREYLRGMWAKWWAQRAEFERLEIPAPLWKPGGQRPMNHPQRRLAALAQIVRHWTKVRALAQRCDPAAITDFFATLTDEFWDFHYTLTSKPSAKRMALVGGTRVTEMLANVFFPLAFAGDSSRWLGFKNLPATLSNRRVEIAALRLFGDDSTRARELLRSAAVQQGLLQIYEDFCQQDASDCVRCRFPGQLAKW